MFGDVYKRQVKSIVPFVSTIHIDHLKIPTIIPNRRKSVSYTHLDVYKRQVQYGVTGGGYTQQDDDCLVVLVCSQCRRFRQDFERVAHVGAQPPVLAERFKFQVVVHFPAVVQQPCYQMCIRDRPGEGQMVPESRGGRRLPPARTGQIRPGPKKFAESWKNGASVT